MLEGEDAGFVTMTLEGAGVSVGGATLDVKVGVSNVVNRRSWQDSTTAADINHLRTNVSTTGTSKEGHAITFAKITSPRSSTSSRAGTARRRAGGRRDR